MGAALTFAPMNVDILAIAAHPDDVELSCSGTLLAEIATGKTAAIVDLTAGELGTRGTPAIRHQEAQASAHILGVSARENLGLADGFFANDQATQLKVIAAIRRYRPTIILTNAPADRHPDHGRAAMLVRDAAWLSGLRKIGTQFEGSNQDPWRPANVFHFVQDRYLIPSFVVDISPFMDKKIASIKAFATQFDTQPDGEPQTYISTPAFLQSVIERSSSFGKMIGVAHAEGFLSEKGIGVSSLHNLIQTIT